MQIVSLSGNPDAAVNAACQIIGAGGVLIYPTDTVYGIGCDATQRQAVERIITMKHREENTRFIVLTDSFASLARLVQPISAAVEEFIRALIPAPVTFVLKSSSFAATHIKGCEQTIAVRIPDNDFCLRVCKASGAPLLSTSANIHGEPTGNMVANIAQDILEKTDVVIDGGTLSNTPSTVVDLSEGKLRILREGALSREQLIGKANGRQLFEA